MRLQRYEVLRWQGEQGMECEFSPGDTREVACTSTSRCIPERCVGEWEVVEGCGGGEETEAENVSTCGEAGAMKLRYRVVREARYEGEPCLNEEGDERTVECFPCLGCGEWSDWGACDGACGGGHGQQTRRYYNANPPDPNCPAKHDEVETKDCVNSEPCVEDCVGEWEPWGECSAACGGKTGQQRRVYTVTNTAKNEGKPCPYAHNANQTRACINLEPCPIHCEGRWVVSSPCNAACGSTGSETHAFVHTRRARHEGTDCALSDGETKEEPCVGPPCPKNCEGGWSDYGPCSVSCGGVPGVKTRTFAVTQPAEPGGNPCLHAHGDTQQAVCSVSTPCPVDCDGGWTQQTPCVNRLWVGKFHVHSEASHGGEPCDFADGEEKTFGC